MKLGDDNIVTRSGISSDALIVNQCGENAYREYMNGDSRIRILSVDDTGLTKSRNLAIRSSQADVCLLCDDDEILADRYEEEIITAFRDLPEADVIVFDVKGIGSGLSGLPRRLKYFELMHVSSVQISFRRESLVRSGVMFDERMGAGSGNGAEEELKFLTDCRRRGLDIYYVPFVIAEVVESGSTWFKGFDEEFFVNRGVTTRYIMGYVPALLYGLYYSVRKRKQFESGISWFKAFRLIIRGMNENRLGRRDER